MGKALYRKYRSRSFTEVVGQDHITQTLVNAIKQGSISHAYLLAGPRGVGKTSVARIIAHAVNDLPYSDDSQHIDIIEIDAASNRRIDEIRELRDKVHIAPANAKYKVYIIDEVHMLTREAFNALLKTLEEPPAHCIFILATTEPHKLPETIISRTQRFNFKPIDKKTAIRHLKDLAKKEKIDVADGALELLAEHGQGSFRDSISLLDQLSTTGEKITEERVRSMLGLPAESAISELIKTIRAGNSAEVLGQLENLSVSGAVPAAIGRELSRQLRKMLVSGSSETWVVELLRQLIDVSASSHPTSSLEIALLEAANKNRDEQAKNLKKESDDKKQKSKSAALMADTVSLDAESMLSEDTFYQRYWPAIVEFTKHEAASLYTALRLSNPQLLGEVLTLNTRFPLHQKKLNATKQKSILGDIVEEITGKKLEIKCVVDGSVVKRSATVSEPAKNVQSPAQKLDEQLQTISNIFGSSEVLES